MARFLVRDDQNRPIRVIEAATFVDADMHARRRGLGPRTEPLAAGVAHARLPVERAPKYVPDPRFAPSVQQMLDERRAQSGGAVIQLRESGTPDTDKLEAEYEASMREAGFLPAMPTATDTPAKATITESSTEKDRIAALEAEFQESLRASGFLL